MTVVVIGDVEFSTNNGIWAFDINLTGILRLECWWEVCQAIGYEKGANMAFFCNDLRAAIETMNHPLLAEACCAGTGPLANLGRISFEQFGDIAIAYEASQRTIEAKRALTRQRRNEFSGVRPHLALAMINAGHPYQCAVEGCGAHKDLTIDHKLALSRGGTDELENLQFMCRPHNSAKGDR